MKLAEYIKKLQVLPDDQKKVIFFGVMGVSVLVALAVVFLSFQRNIDKFSNSVNSMQFRLAASLIDSRPENEDAPLSDLNEQAPVRASKRWLTYQSLDYGFEIKYPDNFSILEIPGVGSRILAINNGREFPDILSINICPFHCPGYSDESKYLEGAEDAQIADFPVKKVIKENELVFYFTETPEADKFQPFEGQNLVEAGKLMVFLGQGDQNMDLFERILTTFKFLNNNE